MTGSSIIQKLDEMLRDGYLDTRAGLNFMGELVKDAFKYIDEERNKNNLEADKLHSFETRIGNVERGLNEFLAMRAREQEAAVDERKFYRRAVVGGIVAIVLSEAARWIFG